MVAKKRGRPVSRPEDLEVFTARLTPDAKRRLMALAAVQGEHAYQLLEKAFWTHWQTLPSGDKAAAEAIVEAVSRRRRKIPAR